LQQIQSSFIRAFRLGKLWRTSDKVLEKYTKHAYHSLRLSTSKNEYVENWDYKIIIVLGSTIKPKRLIKAETPRQEIEIVDAYEVCIEEGV